MKFEGEKMSDKDKNPDFTLDIEEEIEFDDSIFEADEDETEKKEQIDELIFSETQEEKDEYNDLLTEEELENLIIGIDEENDILDIPDEEEVLEELKFLDESFSMPSDLKEETSVVEEKKQIKKPKKEKVPKKEKKPREPFDLKYFLIKNKFKLIGAFVAFIVGIFILTFMLVLNKKPKVEEFEMGTTTGAAIAMEENKVAIPEMNQTNISEEDKEIESLKQELNLVKEETRKVAIQKKIIELENKKILKIRETKILNLKKYFDTDLTNLKVSIIKSEEKILVVAFITQNKDFEEDLFKAISKAFEDDFQIDKVSFSILSQGENFNKVGEMTVDINKFKEVVVQEKTVKEKLKLLNLQVRN